MIGNFVIVADIETFVKVWPV